MYLDGHREILQEVVRTRLPRDFFVGWIGGKRKATLHAIKRGLAYPDLPCGRVRIDRGRRAVLERPLLCSVVALAQLFRPKHQYSAMYQSHLGALAHMHSMSPGHAATAGAVSRAIVSHLLSIGHLFWEGARSRERPSAKAAFWLGVAMHTLTDSYAEAHTVRVAGVRLARAPRPPPSQDKVMKHAAMLYDLAGRTLDRPLSQAELAVAIQRSGLAHVYDNAKLQHETYMLYLMYRQTDRAVRLALPGADRAIAAGVVPRPEQKPRSYDLLAFSYYPTQSTAYHALRDRLALVRDRPAMWARMLDECAELLRIFKDAAAVDAEKTPRRFLERLLEFLATRPFRLRTAAVARRPAMNYEGYDEGDAKHPHPLLMRNLMLL